MSAWFFQKLLFRVPTDGDDEKIFAEIVEYRATGGLPRCWELQIYLSDTISLTGQSMNIKVYTYLTLDFEKMEETARSVILALVPALSEGKSK